MYIIVYMKRLRIYVRNIIPYLTTLLAINFTCLLIPLPIPIQLVSNATLIVHIGCILSSQLQQSSYVAINTANSQPQKQQNKAQKLWQIIKYPLTASIVLLGLYFLITRLNQITMSGLLNTFFIIMGSYYGAKTTQPYLINLVDESAIKWDIQPQTQQRLQLIIKYFLNPLFWICLTLLQVITKHWLLDNIIAIGFSIIAIKQANLKSFQIALPVLWLLFIYDMYWVYASDVMVTVAKSIDLPLKLKFPYVDVISQEIRFSLLGLGDIVLPGLLMALCFKFDIDCCILGENRPKDVSAFKFPLYNCMLWAYAFSLGVTYAAMSVFEHPQPALVFIVPILTISLIIKKGSKRQLELWSYKTNVLALRRQLNTVV